MNKIRVLMIVPHLFVASGVSSFVMNYLRNMNHDKLQMDFVFYDDGDSPYYSEIEKIGGRTYLLPNIKQLPTHIKTCKNILKDGNYDIVHDNALHISIPMMWCAKWAEIPVRILHSHSSKMGEIHAKELRNKMFLPVLRSMATDYVACSQLAGESMFGKRKFTVMPNVIQANKYRFDQVVRERVRQDMNVQDKLVVGTVGRLSEQKNPFFAIDVFVCLLKKLPNVEYWWAGSGRLDKEVASYVEKKGLQKSVKLLGSRSDVIDLYQAMDCFFLPSLFEGLPVTGIEAQAMGLPMVVSDTITDEMVYTDLVDYVRLGDSPEVWAEHLAEALEKKAKREQYTKRLKRSIFSDIGCEKRLENIYDSLINQNNKKQMTCNNR